MHNFWSPISYDSVALISIVCISIVCLSRASDEISPRFLPPAITVLVIPVLYRNLVLNSGYGSQSVRRLRNYSPLNSETFHDRLSIDT